MVKETARKVTTVAAIQSPCESSCIRISPKISQNSRWSIGSPGIPKHTNSIAQSWLGVWDHTGLDLLWVWKCFSCTKSSKALISSGNKNIFSFISARLPLLGWSFRRFSWGHGFFTSALEVPVRTDAKSCRLRRPVEPTLPRPLCCGLWIM